MAAVTGIGGTFFRASNPETLYSWYEQHLGLIRSHGTFIFPASQARGKAAFTFFGPQDNYFPLTQKAMINLQVDDLDGVLERLQSAGVSVDPKRDNYSFGKFGWFTDPEGNRVELWQPITSD